METDVYSSQQVGIHVQRVVEAVAYLRWWHSYEFDDSHWKLQVSWQVLVSVEGLEE